MSRPTLLALLLTLAPLAHGAAPAACSASSPAQRAQLLELYTSQGCNSCPPAERWFATIPPGDRLIPLAFHVDYWDKLGWKDLYSDHRNTERQTRYAKHAREPGVYTPQVFLDGRELREWHRGVPEPAAANGKAPSLALHATRSGANVDARLESRGALPTDALASFALVEHGLSVDIRAGENKGVTLRQEHVVRAYAERPAAPATEATLALPGSPLARLALVAWVQDTRDGTLVQAVRLPLDGCDPG